MQSPIREAATTAAVRTRARLARLGALAGVTSALAGVGLAVSAQAATAPPAPKPHGGAKVSLYATGLKNVTSMAWGDGAMFAGDAGNSQKLPNGGVYVIAKGHAREIPNGPAFVGGMTWHAGALYLSDAVFTPTGPAFQIERWSGFTGSTFTTRTVLYTAPAGFQGFNGLAFGPDGRIYVGVDTGLLNANDHGPATTSPYLYDILSMTGAGQDVQVFASGIRQPWQMAFAPGSADPYVSDLGQDGPAAVAALHPRDFVLHVKAGENYGFPNCNYTAGSACTGAPAPFLSFRPHSDIMGLAIIGRTLYMGSFMGLGAKGGGALFATSLHGGKVRTIVTGFPEATDALAAHGGALYVGGSAGKTGAIYRVRP